jgi:SPP1 gp7 family putative phage head morphogenesis protein
MTDFHLITRRIASRTHIDQIEGLRRAEGAANSVERLVQDAAKQVAVEVVNQPLNFDLSHARRLIANMWVDIANLLQRQLGAIAKWSYRRASDMMVGTVPRQWWQVLIDAGAIQEATVSTSGAGFFPPPPVALGAATPNEGDPCDPKKIPPPGYICVGGLLVKVEDEPIRSGKFTGPERDSLIRKLIFPPMEQERLNEIIFNRGSQSWVDRLSALSRQVIDPQALLSDISKGLHTGQNIQQLTQGIRDKFALPASSAKRIARTEGMRVMAYGQHDAFQKLGALQVGYMHNSVLDQNSRPEHAILNGRDYYFEPNGNQTSVNEIVVEPYHDRLPNCRCWLSPLLAPPKMSKEPQTKFANASKDEIPDPSVYDRWFSLADDPTRKEAVGVGRYLAALDAKGSRPEWKDFVGTDGKLLSADAIRRESDGARRERRLAVEELFRKREQAIRQISNQGFLAT